MHMAGLFEKFRKRRIAARRAEAINRALHPESVPAPTEQDPVQPR
jgi:DNA-directed RNA polymerase subunit K/omega